MSARHLVRPGGIHAVALPWRGLTCWIFMPPWTAALATRGWHARRTAVVPGGAPSIILRAMPPLVADLADACKCAPRCTRHIAVVISLPVIVLDLLLDAAAELVLGRISRSDRRARRSLKGSFTAFFVFWLGSYPALVMLARRRTNVTAVPPLVPSGTVVRAPRAARCVVLSEGGAAALATPLGMTAEIALPCLTLRPRCTVPYGERTLLTPMLEQCTILMLGVRTGAAEVILAVRAASGRLPAHRRIGALQLHSTGGGGRRMRMGRGRSLLFQEKYRKECTLRMISCGILGSVLAVYVGVADLVLGSTFATTPTGCPERR